MLFYGKTYTYRKHLRHQVSHCSYFILCVLVYINNYKLPFIRKFHETIYTVVMKNWIKDTNQVPLTNKEYGEKLIAQQKVLLPTCNIKPEHISMLLTENAITDLEGKLLNFTS